MTGGVRGRWLVVCETAAVPRRTVLLAATLGRAVDVDVFCWSRLGADQVPEALAGGVTLSQGRSLPSFLWELSALLRTGAFHGVVVADFRLLTWIVALASGSGLRVVYDRMEVPVVALAQRIGRWLPAGTGLPVRVAEGLERAVASRAAMVLSVPLAGAAGDHLRTLNPHPLTVHNWPILSETRAGGDRLRDAAPFTVLYSGAVGAATGLDTLLAAACMLRDDGGAVKMVLVGYCVGTTTQEVAESVDRLGLQEVVEVRPRVPYDALPPVLAEAHVGVALLDPRDAKFQSVASGMSRKAFTYMASGLAVVAGGPGTAWIEQEGLGLTVPYGDPSALADGLRALRDDPALCRRLGQAGRQAVVHRYNWEAQEAAILRAVLGPSRP